MSSEFCYVGWKSLHIPIVIIKLSGLNVFIYSVEGVGPRNVRPIKKLGPSILIGFPTCLSTYVFAYLCADRIRHQRDHTCCADRARMADKHQQPDLPSWYCSTFTNCTIKFSHRWMTHDVAQRFPVPVLEVCQVYLADSMVIRQFTDSLE